MNLKPVRFKRPKLLQTPLHAWPMWEGEGNNITDIISRKNNGTLNNGVSWSPNSFSGTNLVFDGSNDYISIPTILMPGEFTLFFCWINNNNSKIAFAISADTGSAKIGAVSSKFFVRIRNNGSSDNTIALPSQGIKHHMAITRDNLNKIDLIIDQGTTNRLFGNAAQAGNFQIASFGRSNAGFGQYLQGELAYVYLYDKRLSDSVIRRIHSSPFEMFKQPTKTQFFASASGGGGQSIIPHITSAFREINR